MIHEDDVERIMVDRMIQMIFENNKSLKSKLSKGKLEDKVQPNEEELREHARQKL